MEKKLKKISSKVIIGLTAFILVSSAGLRHSHAEEGDSVSAVESDVLAELSELDETPAVQEPVPQKTKPVAATQSFANNNFDNEITNLEFRMEDEVSRILISSRNQPNYTEKRNKSAKQYVYQFENTTCASKLQRAYDTTEFAGPVAYFTLIQLPKQSRPKCKLVVQLREDKSPTITPSERGMYIDFPPGSQPTPERSLSSLKRSPAEDDFGAIDKNYVGKPIDLEVKGSDVQDVLRLIGRSSGFNIVIGDDVQGKVGTLSLRGIPWDQALAMVLQSKKLGFVRQGNVLRISTLTNIRSERDEAAATEVSKIKAEPIRTVLIPISYAKASQLAPRSKPFLSERGTVDTDSRTNTIIVRDVDSVVTKIQKLVNLLDIQPPRVTISAKFVEMTTEFSRQIGLTKRDNGAGGLSFSSNLSGLELGPEVSGSAAKAPFSTSIKAANFANLQATLALGESESQTKVLSNPTITITSNQKGTVSAGQTLTVATLNAQGSAAQTITANLSLSIQPTVSSDGSISMAVNLNNDVISKFEPPTVDTRNISTNLLVADGDTAVIGGIFTDKSVNENQGVPFLRKVPIVGALFGGTGTKQSRSEIMIFLTAKILNAEETFKKSM